MCHDMIGTLGSNFGDHITHSWIHVCVDDGVGNKFVMGTYFVSRKL